jgi:hypothetical protein
MPYITTTDRADAAAGNAATAADPMTQQHLPPPTLRAETQDPLRIDAASLTPPHTTLHTLYLSAPSTPSTFIDITTPPLTNPRVII